MPDIFGQRKQKLIDDQSASLDTTFSSSEIDRQLNGITPASIGAATPEDVRLTTERWRGFDTSGGRWIYIRTNIPTNAATHIQCNIWGNITDGSRAVDTQISFAVTAAGLVTATSTNILNRALPFTRVRAFNDTDNTWSIAIPTPDRRHRLLMSVFANADTNAFATRTQENRIVGVTQPTTAEPTGANMLEFDSARMFNYGVVLDRNITVHVATEDGNDLMRGNNRANAVRTVLQAMRMAGSHSNSVSLVINRTMDAQPAAFAADAAYGLNDRCVSAGYVWRSLVANNTRNTPGINSAQWAFDNHVSHPGTTNRGAFSSTGVYSRCDFVAFTAGARAITYMCVQSVTSNQNVHMRPSGTLDANFYWVPISSGNPVVQSSVPGSASSDVIIDNCSGLHLSQTDDLFVIYPRSLTLSNNQRVIVEQRIHVGNTMLIDHNGAVSVMRVSTSGRFHADHCGSVLVLTTLRCSHIIMSQVSYLRARGVITITTDLPTRLGVDIDGANVYFEGALNIRGNNRGFNSAPANNTANGIQVRRGSRLVLGIDNNTCTISGFGGDNISVQAGNEMDIRVRAIVINRDAPADAGMAAQPAIGRCFNIARSAVLRLHRNLATITRNGAVDIIAAEAEIWDSRNTARWNTRGLRA